MRTAHAVLVVVLSALLVFAGVTPASAADLPPVDPEVRASPVNVLPSTVAAGGRLTSGTGMQETYARAMTMVYGYAVKNPDVVAAMKAKALATPEAPITPSQAATIKKATAGYAIPAFQPQKLLKGLDVAGGAMTGLSLGVLAGVEGSRMMGLDPEGTLCHGDPVGNVLSFVGMVDCTMERADEYVPNADAPDTVSDARWANVSVSYVGTATVSGAGAYCYIRSSSYPATIAAQWVFTDGDWRTSSFAGATACGNKFPGSNGFMYSHLVTGPAMRFLDSSGQVLAQMSVGKGDPSRTWRSEVTGSDGKTYTADSEPFKETDDKWTTPKMPELPPGVTPGRIKIIETSPEVPPQTVVDAQPSPEYQHVKNNMADCLDGSCILDLIRESDGKSCFDLDTLCHDWAESEANRAGYRCTYGPHVVALTECGIYRDAFKSGPRESGEWYNDPSAGFEPKPVTNPNTAAGTGTRSALEWAFVPRPEIVQGAQQSIFDARPAFIGSFETGLSTLADAFDSGIGCGGLPFHFNAFGAEVNYQLLNTCEEPAKGIAATVNMLLGAVMIVGAVLATMRYLGSLFGFVGFGNKASSGSVKFE